MELEDFEIKKVVTISQKFSKSGMVKMGKVKVKIMIDQFFTIRDLDNSTLLVAGLKFYCDFHTQKRREVYEVTNLIV